ncbi:hypothetical protein EMIHUDRAFT_220871 [Emiliania huxleyi CCMP1516]|uniref:Uncharacterized protein n=2 Tax=Emiliania huxleyi TaxID=2903 RepID=A0A0D3I0E4_EMIH1|nr:hypothetical protein EMIHUDRAFT_220871 [Emiliania huxleyi CCMP1516]EOD04729.1 hypothetical protein EMIHUDRAFT_220871 [Emiliania huxleyi CCMP1516]|eukprot:XP_005757158.1 hypothetical protein EMIHUDRAFT_220871 [Emiliania huxleyi CCMP1516]
MSVAMSVLFAVVSVPRECRNGHLLTGGAGHGPCKRRSCKADLIPRRRLN